MTKYTWTAQNGKIPPIARSGGAAITVVVQNLGPVPVRVLGPYANAPVLQPYESVAVSIGSSLNSDIKIELNETSDLVSTGTFEII